MSARPTLQFLGATGTVTGSKYLVSSQRTRLLVDCGLFQGYKQLRLRNWSRPPFEPASLDAVVLTHAHIDHSGYLPLLVRDGFKGKIHCSAATADLCAILLPDAGRLQEEEAEYANRRGFSKHKPALPLYTEQDARRALRHLHPLGFGSELRVGELGVTLLRAGHILGAAMVSVALGGRSVLFSGDLGRPNDALMPPPATVNHADWLVLESTYGNRTHDPADPDLKLAAVINRTRERGGVVLIPSFAVGRAQALLHSIAGLKRSGAIPKELPVYLNSPMAVDATAIYHRHPSDHRLSPEDCRSMCRAATPVNSAGDSRRLNDTAGPMVIIAASGMATGGRVVHHLKAFAPDPRNTILFSGFQAGGTRGDTILSGATSVKIHGQYVPVRAEVDVIANYSAHADAGEIMGWLARFGSPPRRTFITHGEPGASDALRRRIEETPGWNCSVPEYLENVEL